MKYHRFIFKIGLLLLLFSLLIFGLLACEPSINIRVQNQTTETLKIFNGDVFVNNAIPGGEVKYSLPAIYSHYSVIAKDMQDNIVFTKIFTREDISGKKTYSVIIPAR